MALQPENEKQEEDSRSVASSSAESIGKLKIRTTVPRGPNFRCSERAQKRKEFYLKLEEKHQALEAERLQNEARLEEERQAAIKQLRKTLIFKANPIPSFYYEGPLPKIGVKKSPPTHSKLPKLGQKTSYGDTTNISQGENKNGVSNKEDTNKLRTAAKIGIASQKNIGKGDIS